ncbi:YwpF-like protein [Lentibacillus persicus]|uniref:YwpF-like protein n=1 Tax=Lentibacillus persicus TaxID=640948 RepID=A0A1I1SS35_9BACI|nr:YwpF-like family protein [Lentibacillus persicus]SFD46723.1 YwpF-like protein [Lentibacillus persicus]
MKTFKLSSLKIIDNEDADMLEQPIPLLDGLIINREDNNSRWVVEAYLDKSQYDFFHNLRKNSAEVLIQAKITKESNRPATFITAIVDMNLIGEQINVIFMGTIVDHRKEIVEKKLKTLIEQGYQGEELLDKFKEQI